VKHSRLMDQRRYVVIDKVSPHVMLSMLAYRATVLAHRQADDSAHVRYMRIKLPQVRREKPGRSPGGPDMISVVPATLSSSKRRNMHELDVSMSVSTLATIDRVGRSALRSRSE